MTRVRVNVRRGAPARSIRPRAAYDVLHEVGARDGYTPTWMLRQVLAERGLDERDPPTTELAPPGPFAIAARWMRCWRPASTDHWPRSTLGCSMSCGSGRIGSVPGHRRPRGSEFDRELARGAGEGPSRFTNAVVMRAVTRNGLSTGSTRLRRPGAWTRLAAPPTPGWIVGAAETPSGRTRTSRAGLLDTNKRGAGL